LAWQAPLDGGFLSFHLARSLPFSLKPTVFVTDTNGLLRLLRFSWIYLPPVEVIHMGGVYSVQDGHHRISVAKTLGEEYVDAEVIDLDC
jgi:hypothetical protein